MRTCLFLVVLGLFTGCGKKDPPKRVMNPSSNSPTQEPSTAVLPADQTPLRNAIRAQCEDMQKKLKNGDLDGFFAYLHPEIIRLAGGLEKLKNQLGPSLETLPQSLEKATIGDISEIVADQGGLSAFVPVETTFRFPNAKVTKKSYNIASSSDQGKTWKFLEGQGRKDQEKFFQSKFPVLTSKFPFPACSTQ